MLYKNKLLFFFINLLIFIFIFSFEVYISRFGSLYSDDIDYGLMDLNTFEEIKSQNAFEKFEKEGGILTEEELNNAKFSNLLDINFILNNKNKD